MHNIPKSFWYVWAVLGFSVVLSACSPAIPSGEPTAHASTSPSVEPTASGQGVVILNWPLGEDDTQSGFGPIADVPATIMADMPTPQPSQATPLGELELFIWRTNANWAIRMELETLMQGFIETHPGIEVVNIAYSTGPASFYEDDPRLMSDSFHTQVGSELIDKWQAGGNLEPMTQIFHQNNWLSQYPSGVLDYVSDSGEIWGVPVNVHRTNVLWYNKSIFSEYNLQPPQTWETFFAAAEVFQEAGITPLALGDEHPWTTTLIFETILQGSLGAEGYRGLWDGRTDWNGLEVKSALETLARIIAYINEDHADLHCEQATRRVIDGEAAMIIMGDWVNSISPTLSVELGYLPAPDTADIFSMYADAFVLPRNVPHRDLAEEWLMYCGSGEAQAALLSIPGAGIPAVKIDRDPALYDAYTQWAMESWAADQIVPTHWVASDADWTTAIHEIIGRFSMDQDVEGAAKDLAQACQ